jgi:class 3 adenylate cyclase
LKRIERRRNRAALPPEKMSPLDGQQDSDVVPISLGDKAQRVYRRSDAVEERHQTDRSWCAYCRPKTATNIVPSRKRPCGRAGRSNCGADWMLWNGWVRIPYRSTFVRQVMELAFLAFRNRVSDHAQPAIEMAMAMQCHLEAMRAEHPELRLRIGIHAGPVVAGVIRR